MGGMLVTAIAFIIWGFIAPRFAAKPRGPGTGSRTGQASLTPVVVAYDRRWSMQRERSNGSAGRRAVIQAGLALLFSAGLSLLPGSPAAAATLDRVRETGKLMLGYRVDARAVFVPGRLRQSRSATLSPCARKWPRR